jgi:hypothetical protein
LEPPLRQGIAKPGSIRSQGMGASYPSRGDMWTCAMVD